MEYAENSVDKCLPCACLAISTIFSTEAFIELQFSVTLNDIIQCITIRTVNFLVLETCQSASENLEAFKSYSKKTERAGPPPVRPSVNYYNFSFDLSINGIMVISIQQRQQFAQITFNCN
jgi:hypothetical protein